MIEVFVGLVIGTMLGFSVCALITSNKEEIKNEVKQEEKTQAQPKAQMKCQHPDGIVIKPDGINELDACVYEEIESHENCTVTVLRCRKCGNIDIGWTKDDFI